MKSTITHGNMALQLVCMLSYLLSCQVLTTLVLVVVTALWRQVDYASRFLMPWQELRRGPTPAQKSILLDYISPLVPTIFWNAIRNRHWAAAVTTLGWLLLMLTVGDSLLDKVRQADIQKDSFFDWPLDP